MATPVSDRPAENRTASAALARPMVLVLPGQERFIRGIDPEAVERVSVRRFPNGELHVAVPRLVDGRACAIVGSVAPPAGSIERLTLVAHALRRAGARRVTALLPYLAYARQDRAEPTEGLGLAWLGGLLRASGVDEVVSVDVHSEAAPSVLGLPLTSLSPAEPIARALPPRWCTDASFVAPDEGAITRCRAVAVAAGSDAAVVYARKRRTPRGIEHLGLVGSPRRRAIVVDDILDTGSTLVSCVRALRAAGVAHIGIATTHALFTGRGWQPLVREAEHLWICDTVLPRHRPPEAEVIPVTSLFAPLLPAATD
jgi:ribose-phosphate pyrophosphokinase